MLLPVFVVIVLFFALLISYPWEVLIIGTLLYLALLPFGWLSYREYERKAAAEGMPASQPEQAATPALEPRSSTIDPPERTDGDRPPRLN
jgi:CDP-diacylglycerol--serine O-phosphatidyltransferase